MISVSVHPFELVYVTVVVPVVNPFTTPVLVTEATAGVDETQAFELAAVVVAVKVTDSPALTDVVPEITGNGFIATLKSAVLVAEQTPLVTTAR
jgi:hypothetical protein